MTKIKQSFPRERLDDIEAALRTELAACGVVLRPGTRVAIAVGSRGIANLQRMVKETVHWVKAQGAEPFIIPAMGSHGGATAEGQREVLVGYGITAEAIGAPILSSMEVVELPQGDVETKVFFDKYAHSADGAIVINRVKPHTAFHGPYESGLMKMLAIGLGKHRQALAIHNLGVRGLREVMPRVARQILRYGNVILGVAVAENAYDETLLLKAVPAARIPDEEPELLALARAHLPRLPIDALDILIVDEIGKNISGTGMDTNVIGRMRILGEPEPESPRIKIIIIRDLSDGAHGNAHGMGLADIMTRRLYDKIDFQATYENVMTTGFLARGKMPVVAETDEEALEYARQALGLDDLGEAKVIRIKNTLRLDEIEVSERVLGSYEF